VAEILRAELGESAYVHTASANRVRQTLRDLRIADGDVLDDTMLRRLSDFTNSQAVVWGQILKVGNQIQIVASMQDIRRGGSTQTLNAVAANEEALLETIGQLANQVRERAAKSLAVTMDLKATSYKPTTSSFTALHEYTVGLELARVGNHADAVKHFTIATKADPEFALAYARLAMSYAAQGYDEDATRAARTAASLGERVSEYDRYLIEATQARILNDTPKAIAALESVLKVSPNDTDILFDLATLHENSGQFQQAREVYAKLLERDPKWVDALLGNGRVLIQLQQPNESLDYLSRALSLSIELDNERARGNVLQALGIAYKNLGKFNDALKNYQEALEIRRRLGQKTLVAASLNEIGNVRSLLGETEAALKSYDEALRIRREIGDRRGIGTVLVNLGALHNGRGQPDAALTVYREALQIQREIGNRSMEALCLNGIGSAYASKGQYDDAQTYYERALTLREKLNEPRGIADTLHNLAEAAIGLGKFDQALTHYLRALDLRRKSDDTRGIAIESFSTGTVFEWQGRFGAAVKARQEAYDIFRRLNDRSHWYAAILTGYGGALSRSGETTNAEPLLAEALTVAQESKNGARIAEALSAEGERLFFAGDMNGARTKLDAALAEASKASDRQVTLAIRLNVEKVAAAASGGGAPLAARLAALAAEADAAGLRHVALEATILRAETLLQQKQPAAAQRDLERALSRAEALNLRVLQAKADALLSTILGATGQVAEARQHRTQALRLFEELRKDAGSDRVLTRTDLAAAYKAVQQ
jgi:tetratricopeptide (TPR) repeat protein